MKRYDEITRLFQEELGYKLIWWGKDDEGKDSWKFQKGDELLGFNKETLEEHYNLSSKLHYNILERAEKISNEMVLKNWEEHRRIDDGSEK